MECERYALSTVYLSVLLFTNFVCLQSSFSQLNYIPESQPLFEKEEVTLKDSTSEQADAASFGLSATVISLQDTPVGNDGVGAGMAAVRAMYLNGGLDSADKESPARSNAVPFQSLVESPEVNKNLFDSVVADFPVVDTPAEASLPEPAPEEPSLPAETWIQCYDEESGWPYVYNEATGEVKWVEPESTEQLMAELWEVCYDEDGNQFYYNSVSVLASVCLICCSWTLCSTSTGNGGFQLGFA